MLVHFSCTSQPGHTRVHFIQALLLLLLLDQRMSAVALVRFVALASPRLVLIVWVVFFVLQSQPLGLLNKGTFLCFREKSEEDRDESENNRWCFKHGRKQKPFI